LGIVVANSIATTIVAHSLWASVGQDSQIESSQDSHWWPSEVLLCHQSLIRWDIERLDIHCYLAEDILCYLEVAQPS